MKNKTLLRVKALTGVFILLYSVALAQHGSDCAPYSDPVTFKQANGTTLTVVGKGSDSNSWIETLDGYTVVRKNGLFHYANKVNGKLVASSVAARNAGQRTTTELTFLQKLSKSIKPDAPASKKPIPGSQMKGYPVRTVFIVQPASPPP